jgi:hypothetical protein
MKLLPATDSSLLASTLILVVFGFVWLVFRGIQIVFAGQLIGLFSVLLGIFLGSGLWLRLRAARLFVLAVLWFFVIVVPLGTINPFAAMDHHGPNLPSAWELVLRIAPPFLASLFGIHVLGKYKNEFRWWPKSAD